MPEVVSDIVDVYVFRRLNARVQFLLLQRRADVALGQTWQSFHTRIERNESTLVAARRAVVELSGLHVSAVFSADYVNQFYDDVRDLLVLAPVIAVNVSPQAPVRLGPELRDCAWLDRDEATARLPFTGQRWAVRHIDEIMSIGDRETELYRLRMPPVTSEPPAPVRPIPEPAATEVPTGDDTSFNSSPVDAWENGVVDPVPDPDPAPPTDPARERTREEAGRPAESSDGDEQTDDNEEADSRTGIRSYVPISDE